jgi:hypothetical protein
MDNVDETITNCKSAVEAIIKSDKQIHFMLERIHNSIHGKNLLVQCRMMDMFGDDVRVVNARAFFMADGLDNKDARPPEIVVVASRVHVNSHNDEELKEVLRHELVHALDHCVYERDLRDIHELSCSEIRAHMAAECDKKKLLTCRLLSMIPSSSIMENNPLCSQSRWTCTKKLASKAVGNVFPTGTDAQNAVASVMSQCFIEQDMDKI